MNDQDFHLRRAEKMAPRPRAQGLWFVLVALFSLCGFSLVDRTTAADPDAKPIQLTIDYGDGVQKRFAELPFTPDMMVLDALAAAKKHRHGITFAVQGTGQNAFINQIDDVKNEGGGEKAKNWMFRINGKDADRGVGVYKLASGDSVLWRFAVFEYNPGDKESPTR